jgi:hypothetical protein
LRPVTPAGGIGFFLLLAFTGFSLFSVSKAYPEHES